MRSLVILFLLLAGTATVLPIQKKEHKKFRLNKNTEVHLDLKYADSIYITGIDESELDFQFLLETSEKEFSDAHFIDYDHSEDLLNITTGLKEGYGVRERGDIHIEGASKSIICTVAVPKNNQISIKSITGNVQVRGMNGEVRVKTVAGFIDCDWDEKPADLRFNSTMGEVFTDIDIEYETPIKDMPIVGYPIRGKIKNGGTHLNFENVTGNIYFRRRK